jgi:chaperonin GroES
MAVGPGRTTDDGKLQAIDVKVGDTVVFGKYSGTEVKVDGEELLIIREDDVLGVMES